MYVTYPWKSAVIYKIGIIFVPDISLTAGSCCGPKQRRAGQGACMPVSVPLRLPVECYRRCKYIRLREMIIFHPLMILLAESRRAIGLKFGCHGSHEQTSESDGAGVFSTQIKVVHSLSVTQTQTHTHAHKSI